MIDFRYHLVSIIAVFLALALGIVVGSTALQPSTLRVLDKTSSADKSKIDSLYAQKRQLQQQLSSAGTFAQTSEPRLLGGLLAGQQVVLVEAPGAPSQVINGVTSALTVAGATVTGQIQIQSQLLQQPDPATRSALTMLNQQFTPPGTALRSGSVQAQADQVIASAILTDTGSQQPTGGTQAPVSTAILQAYTSGGFLSVPKQPTVRATLAVVVIPASPPTNTSDGTSQALVALAQQFGMADKATVLAGSVAGSAAGSAIDVLRSSAAKTHLTSVDNADSIIGQIVLAQAMYQQLAGGQTGSYGSGPGATGPGPSPAPSPSPTASVTPTPGSPGKRGSHLGSTTKGHSK